jgi:hypothetical protein
MDGLQKPSREDPPLLSAPVGAPLIFEALPLF